MLELHSIKFPKEKVFSQYSKFVNLDISEIQFVRPIDATAWGANTRTWYLDTTFYEGTGTVALPVTIEIDDPDQP